MSHWRAGDHIILREVRQNRVWTGRPVIVVDDSHQAIALYIANGSRWKRPFDADGSPKRVPAGDWELRDDLWTNDVIRISIPGERFSALPFLNREGELRFWYLNIETPLRRTPLGFDYMDQTLDIIVSADLREWRWKDEDELAEAVACGVYTEAQARDIRAAGERALKRFLAREPPFDEAWEDWCPDPAWSVPELISGWETVTET